MSDRKLSGVVFGWEVLKEVGKEALLLVAFSSPSVTSAKRAEVAECWRCSIFEALFAPAEPATRVKELRVGLGVGVSGAGDSDSGTEAPVGVDDAGPIATSFPDFIPLMRGLGAEIG